MLTLKELHDSYNLAELYCGMIEDLLIHRLEGTVAYLPTISV